MDCRKVIEEIVEYFRQGKRRDAFGFFDRPHEPLKDMLREKYFQSYREGKKFDDGRGRNEEGFSDGPVRPRTTTFITYTLNEILDSIKQCDEINGSVVDNTLNRLRESEYNYLLAEGGNEELA